MKLAHWVQQTKPSFIREILKLTANPDVISFAGGLPAPELFPVQKVQQAYQTILAEQGRQTLQYSPTEGDEGLRTVLARHLSARRIPAHPDNILLTNGSQHALDLVAKAFFDVGDVALVENPTYLGAIQAFGPYRPQLIAVPSDEEGMTPEGLTNVLKAHAAKFVYMMPTFQNPRGSVMSLARRQELVAICRAADVPIVEDDPYGELRYSGDALPGLRYFWDEVIYLGTLSKTVAPGMRLGWVVAPPSFTPALKLGLQATCLNVSLLTQRVAASMLGGADHEQHLQLLRAAYRDRRDCMIEELRSQFPTGTTWTEPDGGLFLWVTLPEGLHALTLIETAVQHGVAFVPGDPFYVGNSNPSTLRMNFSNSTPDQIREGMRRLRVSIETVLAETVAR